MWYTDPTHYVWVKYHFKTEQGIRNFTREDADRMKSINPDHATKDLFDAIKSGEFPSWRVDVQIMQPEDAATYRFDPFDVTKVWPHKDYPLIPLGRMVLNRNPENYFNEVEQSAFAPSNFVPGIGPSPDKLLQGRLFSYHDTHLHRLGTNYHMLPVNSPKAAEAQNYQRDGAMNYGTAGSVPNYYPNSFQGPEPDPSTSEPALPVSGYTARQPFIHPNDDYFQPGELFRSAMNDQDREHLIGNIVSHLVNAQKRLQYRQTALFYNVDSDYGSLVAEGLGLDIAEVKRLAALSQDERVKATSN